MSVENVSVSLSRLRLAKAIKDEDPEPWTKSVLFYQSHISPGMREALTRPRHQVCTKQDHSREKRIGCTDNNRSYRQPMGTPRSGKKQFIPKDSDSESENDNDDSLSDDHDTDDEMAQQRGESEDTRRPRGRFFDNRVIQQYMPPSPQMFGPWYVSYYMQLQQQHFMYLQQVATQQMMMISGKSAKLQRGQHSTRSPPPSTRLNRIAPQPPGMAPCL